MTDAEDVLLAPRFDHEEHPLLRFAEEHLLRRHPDFAPRHEGEIDVHADPAPGGHLA
jgi:hypothetical protein